jgi:hypothetical protein
LAAEKSASTRGEDSNAVAGPCFVNDTEPILALTAATDAATGRPIA